jgi:hypothetical protein
VTVPGLTYPAQMIPTFTLALVSILLAFVGTSSAVGGVDASARTAATTVNA